MDTEITLHVVPEGKGSDPFPLVSLTERAALYVARDLLRPVRTAHTTITLLSTRANKWSVPYNFFDNRTTLEQLSRLSIVIQEGILKMPKNSKQRTFERAEWKGFLEYTLNEQELEAADAWKLSSAQLWEGVNALTAEGYRLTLSYSKPLSAYTATLQAGNEQGGAAGWALSARDEKAEAALKLLLWKHFVGLDGKWSDLLSMPKRATRG